MFDIGSSELLLIIIVAVVVIGPKDLPRVLYKLGQIIGKGRAMTRHFRSGIDEMIRQAEMEEMEKKWAADNARIMAQNPAIEVTDDAADPALPAPDISVPETVATPDGRPGTVAQPTEDGFKPFVAAPTSEPESMPKPKSENGPTA